LWNSCIVCGKNYYVRPSSIDSKTCSRKCYNEFNLKRRLEVLGEYILCDNGLYKKYHINKKGDIGYNYFYKSSCIFCGKECFRVHILGKREIATVCSKECKKELMRGKQVKGLKYKTSGSILQYSPNHINNRKGYVAQHRLVIEEDLGRILSMEEVVHHINMDNSDNELDNLYLCRNASCHNKAHASLNYCVKDLINRGCLKFNKEEGIYILGDNIWKKS